MISQYLARAFIIRVRGSGYLGLTKRLRTRLTRQVNAIFIFARVINPGIGIGHPSIYGIIHGSREQQAFAKPNG